MDEAATLAGRAANSFAATPVRYPDQAAIWTYMELGTGDIEHPASRADLIATMRETEDDYGGFRSDANYHSPS